MNRLKRNVLLGVGLSVLALAGTALAEDGPAQPGAPAAKAGMPPAHAGKAAPKAGAATVQHPSGLGPNGAVPGRGDGKPAVDGKPKTNGGSGETLRGGPAGAKGEKPNDARLAPPGDGEARRRPPVSARVSPALRRAQLKAMREVRLAERDYYTIQQLRLEGGPEAAKALAEAEAHQQKARKQAMKELRLAQKAQDQAEKSLSKGEKKAVKAKLKQAAQKHAADRKQRAEAERAALVKAHGAKLDKPAVQAELRRHAWRLARLTRLSDIAQAMGKEDLVAKAAELMQTENAKHEVRLAAFLADKMPELPPGFALGRGPGSGSTPAGGNLQKNSEKKKAPVVPRPAAAPVAKEGAQ